MDLDIPLDEVIAKKKTRSNNRGRGRGGRGSGPAAKRTVSSSDPRGRYAGAAPASNGRQASAVVASPVSALPGDGSKIIVSGLPDDVNEPMVRDLFTQTVGRIKTLSMAYDSRGKPTGTATIEFVRAGDGAKAYADYNGRLIDQRRPMKIEIIVDPSRVPPAPLASRLAPPKAKPTPAPAVAAVVEGDAEGSGRRRGGGGGRRGRGRGRGGRNRSDDRPAKTEAELDAEMEAYTAQPAENA